MHLAVNLYVFHHFAPVSLQAAVEIVQIPNAAHLTCRSVEELGRQGFRQGVVALLLVAGYEVVAVFRYHAVEFGNLVGRVLQVGVHGNDDTAPGGLETAEEGGRLAVVAPKLDAVHTGVVGCKTAYHLPRIIRTAVVDKDYFVGKFMLAHHAFYPGVEFGQALGLVVEGHDDRNVYCIFHLCDKIFIFFLDPYS